MFSFLTPHLVASGFSGSILPDSHVFARVEEAAEMRVWPSITGAGIPDDNPFVVGVSGRRPAGLMPPESFTVLPIPMVIASRPDNQRYEPARAFQCRRSNRTGGGRHPRWLPG